MAQTKSKQESLHRRLVVTTVQRNRANDRLQQRREHSLAQARHAPSHHNAFVETVVDSNSRQVLVSRHFSLYRTPLPYLGRQYDGNILKAG